MSSVPNPEPDDQPRYPRSWTWPDDGNVCAGTYVKFSSGPSNYSDKPTPIIVLTVDGEDRSVWLRYTAQLSKVQDEVRQRPGRDLDVGERVVITHRGQKTSKSSGNPYIDFTVEFPDGPAPSAAGMLGLDDKPSPTTDEPELPVAEDDIPF